MWRQDHSNLKHKGNLPGRIHSHKCPRNSHYDFQRRSQYNPDKFLGKNSPKNNETNLPVTNGHGEIFPRVGRDPRLRRDPCM